MRLPLLGAACLLYGLTSAVFADEAWNTDYQYALLGLPQDDATFFHQPNPASKASLIFTVSSEGVLGAVNPRDGTLVWRQALRPSGVAPNSTFLRAGRGEDIVISGADHQAAAWSAADGRLAWDVRLLGTIEDVEILELGDGTGAPGSKDAIVLTSGNEPSVQRIDAATGSIKWKHRIDSGDAPYQISASATGVYVILLHKTMLGYIKIKVNSLDPVTGSKKDEYVLSSENELASADTIISVGANSACPIIVWTDAGHTTLKVNIIGTKTVSTFNIEKHDAHAVQRVRLQAPSQANSLAHFLVHYDTDSSHWADVFHVDLTTNKVEKAYGLPKLPGKGAFSTSNSDANVYFTRVTRDEVTTVSSVSHGILGRWPLKDFGVIAGVGEVPEPVSVVSELSLKTDAVSAARSAVLLSTGSWVLLRDGSPVWQRPEILASTGSATFAVSTAVEAFAQDLKVEAQSNLVAAYLHRVNRHVQDLQRLPEALRALPARFLNGLFGTTADSGLGGNVFGFHQVIACATKTGRVIALDAGNPNMILWNQQAVTVPQGHAWRPNIRSQSDGTLVLTHTDGVSKVRLNATTGEPVFQIQSIKIPDTNPGSVEFTVRDGKLEATRAGGKTSSSIWHFIPAVGERIVSLVTRPVNDPVASIGKVLGDRRVLYKFLSPNLALLVTASDAAKFASIHILDTVTGSPLFSCGHSSIDLNAPITSIMSENWFAYSFTAESSDDFAKGHYLVVGEMFESLLPDVRIATDSSSNFSSIESGVEPFVLTKTYQISEPISQLSVTQTRQGITSRQLLAVLSDSSSIVGIPYGVLDPRRPAGRDPTKLEQAEGLMRYSPTLEFDPSWILNHKRELLGVTQVITNPALIESTSLVFAYGLDLFGTRLSPSFSFDILGKDFNKFQMLATVAALAVATFVVAPLVTRKQVNTRWQFA